MHRRTAVVLLALAGLAGCQSAPVATVEPGSTGAALYDGVGVYRVPIATDSPEAQRWFDQGLGLLYGFNHDEAVRSFREAAARDPEAPMPWWGVAVASGMNINDPVVPPDRWKQGYEASRQALRRIDNGTTLERDLVRAVAERFGPKPPADAAGQRRYDEAYAGAMRRVYANHPRDPDVGALYAESLLNLQPWDYWTPERTPKGNATEIVGVLEAVLEREPTHPGANHFYIHAMEASYDPAKAEAAADRLVDRVPGAGHLVHMPSHIYVHVGRYSDAADVNAMAVEADRKYFERAPEPALYNLYYAHNLHFLAFASMMSGRSEDALEAARALEAEVPEAAVRAYASLIEGITPTTFHALIRFGRWEEILEEPERPDYRLVTRAVRRYARAIALAALGRPSEARTEAEAFEEAFAAIPGDWWIFNNKVSEVLPIARAMLEGEIAWREGRRDEAYAALRRGIEREDRLVYDEPPAWMFPVRHALGALLMSDGRFEEAERVYREDLEKNRDNGWSLLGLRETLKAQGREAEAEEVDAAFQIAWRDADVQPKSSCYCEPGLVQH